MWDIGGDVLCGACCREFHRIFCEVFLLDILSCILKDRLWEIFHFAVRDSVEDAV